MASTHETASLISATLAARRGRLAGCTFVLILLAMCEGCGGKSRLEVAPVRGRVTYRGQGVPKATVIFHPADDASENAKKMRPFAYADDQGNFALKTYVDGDGAPPGKYRVSVIAVSSGTTKRNRKDAPASETTLASTATVSIPPDITKKYSNVDTAGIEVTVLDGENSLPPFAL